MNQIEIAVACSNVSSFLISLPAWDLKLTIAPHCGKHFLRFFHAGECDWWVKREAGNLLGHHQSEKPENYFNQDVWKQQLLEQTYIAVHFVIKAWKRERKNLFADKSRWEARKILSSELLTCELIICDKKLVAIVNNFVVNQRNHEYELIDSTRFIMSR